MFTPARINRGAVPLGSGTGFRIGESVDSPIGMEDNSAGHDRPRQASPPHFVNARDRYESVAVEYSEQLLNRAGLQLGA